MRRTVNGEPERLEFGRIIFQGPVTTEQQATYLNAIPLLALGGIYLIAAASLVPSVVRERRRIRELELAPALVFPCGGAAALIFGLLVLEQRRPVGGNAWLGLLAILIALGPAIVFFARFRTRALLLTGSTRALAAEQWISAHDRERRAAERVEAAASFEDAARALVDETVALVAAEFGALVVIDPGGTTAHGVVGRASGEDVEWLRDVEIDLVAEPSGVASAYHEAAPYAVYDAEHSHRVSPRLVERAGVKSIAYVPILADQRVIAVLIVASRTSRRAFTSDELSRLQGIAGESAGPLARLRSSTELDAVIERERVIGAIATRIRSAHDPDSVVEVATSEVASALGVQRCFVRLGDGSGAPELRGEWRADGLQPIGTSVAARLPVANLAARERQTVASADVATDSSLDDESLGGRNTLLELGSRAVLAVPIVVFDRLVGVFGVHRAAPGAWSRADVALVEAAAREVGLALDTARLLEENAERLRRETRFFSVATLLGQSLSLQATLDALAQAAVEAFGGSSAAVVARRAKRFALVGSHSLPERLRAALDEGVAEDDALRLAAGEGRVLAAPSLAEDRRFGAAWQEVAKSSQVESLLVVPVETPRAEAAALVLVFFASRRDINDYEVELAQHLAEVARGALERAELFETERTSRSLAQQLARTGSVLATELDPAAVLDEVVDQAPALVNADASAVWTCEGDEIVVTAVHGEGTEAALGTRADGTGWLSGEVVQSRRPVSFADVREATVTVEDPLLNAGYTAFLGVPLLGPENTLHGVLALYSRRPRAWRSEEVEAVLALAANTSAALSNAELYQRVAIEKERGAAILENVADGIVAVDRDGNVVLWNRAAEQITGVPAAEAVGRPPEQALGRTLSGHGLVSVSRAGGEIWLSVTEAVMRDPAGAVAGRIYAFRDISADRLLEQMKSEFVSTVSHELRTPLTSIYGFAETLLREDVLFGDEERRTFLRYIASESERLTNIVDALLNVARLDTGDLRVDLAPTDVRPVLADVVQTASQENGGNGHNFVLDIPAEPLAAEADADKLRQVVQQLVDNAVKYSPGGGTVTIAARRNHDRVEFEVVDEGVGIPESERERIFRKFYRAESRTSVSGTGVGLFIVQGLVNAMGGRIWVADSAEGSGSRFAFELPVARV